MPRKKNKQEENRPAARPRLTLKLLLPLAVLLGGVFCCYELAKGFVTAPPEPDAPKLEQTAPETIYPLDPEWDKMTERITKTANRFQGRMAVYLKDLSTGRTWELNADEEVPSASLIKVPIMAALLEQAHRGNVRLDEKLVMTRADKVGGSGKLRRWRNGTRFTIRELMHTMITESDNTAAHLLIKRLGMAYLQSQFAAMGLQKTNITPEGMSLDSYGVARENYTTAREMAGLLERIYKGELVTPQYSGLMLETMKHLRHATRFSKRLPSGWRLAHKTGMLRQSCHDAGIFFSPDKDYLMVVLSWQVPDYRYAARQITKVAEHTFGYYRQFKIQTAGAPEKRNSRSL
ncbi:MAG TPA: class A beta-lactamase-related serine hydrolase [Elusimicrobiales bacterium]|nr:class A beta-lactamase-related serine hydrolase [Elusimicrobiales bacterium]